MNINKIFLKAKSWVGRLSYYVLPLGLIGATALMEGRELKHFFVELGSWSWILVMLILFVKPLGVIFKSRLLMMVVSLRRELGVAAFWTFLFHGAGLIWMDNLVDVNLYLDWRGYLFWGGVAGVGMILLGVTSNEISVKWLGKNWKRLQYVAYPVLFFATAHKTIAEEGTVVPAIVIFTVFVFLKVVEKWRRKVMAK